MSRSLLKIIQGPNIDVLSSTRTMERLVEYNPLLLYAIGLVTLSLFYLLFRNDAEAAVPYNVTPPEQIRPGWKGEVLDELTMKVGLLHNNVFDFD